MRFIFAFLLIILGNHVAALDVKTLFEASRPSVVLIVAYDENDQPSSIGSGFYFGDEYTLATNLHVIQNASKIAIKLSSGQTGFVDTVLGVDQERDLAILQTNVSGLPLSLSKRSPDIGEDIIAIGNPSGLEGTVSTGIISGIRTEDGSQYYQITAPISPGSSGGPIISENKEVLGVSTFYLDGAQSLNFAMPSAYLMKLYNNKSKIALSSLVTVPKKERVPANENVVVMSPEWETCYTDDSCNFTFTIGNKSQYEISNVKLMVKFYKNLNDELPLNFMLTEFKGSVPSRLGKRVKKSLSVASRYWEFDFTVLDYEINRDITSSELLKFD